MSPFIMLQTVINKLHERSQTGIKIPYNTFSQYYYIPNLEKWLGFFLLDDYSLDLKTLQQQQSQDPVLRIVYSGLINKKP